MKADLVESTIELYGPRTMAAFGASRKRSVPKAIEFMACLHRDGGPH